ncbi:NAD(P)-dependent oxidoreductase [Vannielia litorea]|uniref:NAD(P)-dependent oxidoreductase n=1 Tax=Vannielia litorea TaxID=1217970 RepID=UPI001C96C112|nr:NAD(P)-dependent oxidoreductase [Vannielia litorea]MBY6046477.1 DUF1932 domain-containing protein [Vannielia litorea]MBY6073890.1 DUF1932 domain-containing protein [Vannielia litorea]
MSDNAKVSNRIPVVLLGFGEAGQAFTAGWKAAGVPADLSAFDIKTNSPDTAEAKRADYAAHGVEGLTTLSGSGAVFSLVTADHAEAAAQDAAAVLAPGTLFFDCNSCSPGAKRHSAAALEAQGIRYVDVAVMAPVHPKLHHTPLLISGPHTQAAVECLHGLDMEAQIAGPDVGIASATKMVRSVMIKGIEALTLECLLAGRRAGVDEAVLASLDASMPGWNWPTRAAYNMERATTHGLRRAAEMREVARTVEELGLPADMSHATVAWQQRTGDLSLRLADGPEEYAGRADRISNAMAGTPRAAE